MFLTREELETLTGCKARRGILRWLDQSQWHYALNAARFPVVLRSYAEAKLSGTPLPAARALGPNLVGLRKQA